jgi:hypothetical protein
MAKRFVCSLLGLGLLLFSGNSLSEQSYVVLPDQPLQIQRYDDTDFTEHQMSTFGAQSFDDCAKACVKDPVCRAFTYKDRYKQCYLHSEPAGKAHYSGAVSGVVLSRAAGGNAVNDSWGSRRSTSCSAKENGACTGCSVSCPAGRQASCSEGESRQPPNIAAVCWTQAKCECK